MQESCILISMGRKRNRVELDLELTLNSLFKYLINSFKIANDYMMIDEGRIELM